MLRSAAIHMAFHDRRAMTAAMNHPPARPVDQDLLRTLPQVQKLMESEAARELTARFPRSAVVNAIRDTLEALRRAVLAEEAGFDGLCPESVAETLLESARAALEPTRHSHLRRVINGTGIIHTNPGRAPMAEAAIAAVAEAASFHPPAG